MLSLRACRGRTAGGNLRPSCGEREACDPGVYHALRQSVGPKLGSALGAAFYLAFTVDVCWYVSGFSETLTTSAGISSLKQAWRCARREGLTTASLVYGCVDSPPRPSAYCGAVGPGGKRGAPYWMK